MPYEPTIWFPSLPPCLFLPSSLLLPPSLSPLPSLPLNHIFLLRLTFTVLCYVIIPKPNLFRPWRYKPSVSPSWLNMSPLWLQLSRFRLSPFDGALACLATNRDALTGPFRRDAGDQAWPDAGSFFFFCISSSHIVNSVCWSHALVNCPTSKRPASDGGLCSGQLLMMWAALSVLARHTHMPHCPPHSCNFISVWSLPEMSAVWQTSWMLWSLYRPTHVRSLFRVVQCFRLRSYPLTLVHWSEHMRGWLGFRKFFANKTFGRPNWDANSWEEGPTVDTNSFISPETIEQELRPAVCEHRQTDLRTIIV